MTRPAHHFRLSDAIGIVGGSARYVPENPLFADLPPGVRMVREVPYIFDMDALNDWRAIEAKIDAPADLSGLTDQQLTGLSYRAIRIAAMSGHRDLELFERVAVESERRKAEAVRRVSPDRIEV